MFKRFARSRYGQEALGFLLASYLRFVQRTNRFVSEPADLEPAFRGEDAGDRRDVARPASDAVVRLAQGDRAYGGAHLAQRRRRHAGGGVAAARRHPGARLGRTLRPRSAQGRRAGAARIVARARRRRVGGDDRRRRQASRASPASGSSRWRASRDGRSCRWRSSPSAGSISNPGTAPASACRSTAARSSSAIPSTCPPDADDDGDGDGAAGGRGRARRRSRARLRHGRRARSRRGFEASMSLPLSLSAYRLATRPRFAAERGAAVAAAQQGQGRSDAGRRAARHRQPRAPGGPAGLAARRQRRRGPVADAAGRSTDRRAGATRWSPPAPSPRRGCWRSGCRPARCISLRRSTRRASCAASSPIGGPIWR